MPTFWNRDLPALVESGDLRATQYVRWEVEEQDDELLTWIKDIDDLFVPIDDGIQPSAARSPAMRNPRLLALARQPGDRNRR